MGDEEDGPGADRGDAAGAWFFGECRSWPERTAAQTRSQLVLCACPRRLSPLLVLCHAHPVHPSRVSFSPSSLPTGHQDPLVFKMMSSSDPEASAGPLQPLMLYYTKGRRQYQQWLDRVTPFVLYRWLSTAGLLAVFMLRIVLSQGVSIHICSHVE